MPPSAPLRRQILRRVLLASGVLLAIVAPVVPRTRGADTAPAATLFLRPHCPAETASCPTYTVIDPETMSTPPLSNDAILDMDLVASNPAQRTISRVRTWLQYNPAVFEGTAIDAGAALPAATPGEKDFSATDGFIKIEVSAAAGQEPLSPEIVVARIRLTVKSVPPTNADVLSFYDVQPAGHTRILATQEVGEPEDILTQTPGSLLVAFQQQTETVSSSSSALSASGSGSGADASSSAAAASEATSSAAHAAAGSSSLAGSAVHSSSAQASSLSAPAAICGNGLLEAGEECDDGNFLAGDGCAVHCLREVAASSATSAAATSSSTSVSGLLPDGSVCGSHAACTSGLCSGGVCRGDVLKVEDGGACNASGQCIGGACVSNRCGTTAASSSASSVSLPEGKTAFTLLQVQNVRITTEGTSLYVAWDPLVSSQLKAYNLYYGSTTGRYLQRKTVSLESTSMAVRGLPEKATYYVAIRGLSQTDEETAFSQEVSVEVGNPKTSTAPLTGDLLATRKPVTVPGETGIPSVILLLLSLSAVIGTTFAMRRQTMALTSPAR